jgi:hypothetical protein
LLDYGAEVIWALVLPIPHIVLISGDETPANTSHSVLVVQTMYGETFIFDCTREQFGWQGCEWLLELRDFKEYVLDKKLCAKDVSTSLESARRGLVKQDSGYWGRILKTFEHMWEELEWDHLKELGPTMAEELIRKTAAKRAEAAARETWGAERH